ncbi:hypothetical protein BDZ45DRAFT_688234 [Acephala macrosclerotiorum]|nr:hypothetical protein BDZ45DRAFT_688234 [Acephala macrosclerotiorum]
MLRSPLDEGSDGKKKGDLNGTQAIQSLSCPSCDATGFPNLSKLNKHRNTHEKPYECQEEGCSERFAQKQALNRHTQAKHSNTIAKYYHCTVDGCKYSSTCRRGKRFVRADQVKEHIKDYGHYGPHSANNRPRRRADWGILFDEYIITARFEEWTLDDGSPRRTIQSCEYNPSETRLWHTDDIGELFVKESILEENKHAYECPAADCYFRIRPPDGCDTTLFKTMKALKEHYRRAHEALTPGSYFPTHLQEGEKHGSVSDSSCVEPSNYSLENNTSLTSIVQDFSSYPEALDFPMFSEDLDDFLGSLSCHAGQGIPCFCQSCSQKEAATSESLNIDLEPRHQSPGLASEFQFQSLSPSPSIYETYFPTANVSEDIIKAASTASANSTSLKSSRMPCSLPGCGKTFRRKYELQRHIACLHTPSFLRRCPFCEREFRRKDKLTDHLRKLHSTSSDLDSTKMKTMLTGVSSFSANDCQWLSSEYPPGKDVAPADTLIKAGSSTASWTEEPTFTFQFQPGSLEDDLSHEKVRRPASPISMQRHSGITESPIVVDEPGHISFWTDHHEPFDFRESVASSF